jgi:putative Holliday junction resolvase
MAEDPNLRSLGIDFGERRIGVAVSDEAGRIATPLTTLERSSDRQALRSLARLARDEGVERLVVGEPRALDGTPGEAAERTRRFAEKLAAVTGLPHVMVDEALTTDEARRRLREAGVDLRRHPERVDAAAAQIILQELLDAERSEPTS